MQCLEIQQPSCDHEDEIHKLRKPEQKDKRSSYTSPGMLISGFVIGEKLESLASLFI